MLPHTLFLLCSPWWILPHALLGALLLWLTLALFSALRQHHTVVP